MVNLSLRPSRKQHHIGSPAWIFHHPAIRRQDFDAETPRDRVVLMPEIPTQLVPSSPSRLRGNSVFWKKKYTFAAYPKYSKIIFRFALSVMRIWYSLVFIHSMKPTWPLKNGGGKTTILVGNSIFRCYVSFRESTPLKTKMTSENRRFSIGDTSSFMVLFPLSCHVCFLGCTYHGPPNMFRGFYGK